MGDTREPPFATTAEITVGMGGKILDENDPTSLQSVTYLGQGMVRMLNEPPDGGPRRDMMVDAHLFDVEYTGLNVQFQVQSKLGNREEVRDIVDTLAVWLGRLPAVLLSPRLIAVQVHATRGARAGNGIIEISKFFVVHENRAELARILLHEAAHVSLDSRSHGWIRAQVADGTFISEYARNFPGSEDIAESFPLWFAARYHPDRLSGEVLDAILTTIPNRLAYFDEQGFDMTPYELPK